MLLAAWAYTSFAFQDSGVQGSCCKRRCKRLPSLARNSSRNHMREAVEGAQLHLHKEVEASRLEQPR